jgi:hypothetical protein
MQALKLLVVGLGVLIVISIALLGWGFYTKFNAPKGAADASPGALQTPPASGSALSTIAAAATAAFGEIRAPLPEGCTAVEMRPTAERLYLRTGPTGLCERIFVFDNGGRLLGSILLAP